MLTNIAKKIFGSRNDRLLKQYRKSVAKINALEKQMRPLSDAELQLKQLNSNNVSPTDKAWTTFWSKPLLSPRSIEPCIGMRHFDVQ